MHTRKVTVRKSFCPDVHFEADFFREDFQGRVNRVLDMWRMITGLSWQLMPREDAHDGDLERTIVVNPMDNQSKVVFYWDKCDDK